MRCFCSNNGGVGSGSHPLLGVWLEVGRWDVFGRRRRHLCSPGGWLRRRRRLVLHLCERGGSFQYSPSAGPGFRPLASPAVADCCSCGSHRSGCRWSFSGLVTAQCIWVVGSCGSTCVGSLWWWQQEEAAVGGELQFGGSEQQFDATSR